MNIRVQNFLLFLFAAALVGGTGLAIKYSTGYRPLAGFAPSGPMLPGDVAIRFSKVRVIGRKNNRRAWIMRADQVDTTRAKNRVDFRGNIRAELLDNEKIRAVVTAPQAVYDVTSQVLTANGKLVCVVQPSQTARRPGNLKVQTDSLVWNVGAKNVLCPGDVTAVLPDARISGKQFSVDLKTHDFTLTQVRAEFALSEGQEPQTLGEGYLP